MHATNTFPVDRHPQYRHYPTMIHSIASGIIIEVEKNPHQKRLEKYLKYERYMQNAKNLKPTLLTNSQKI
jgi:hypothetical protein